MAIVVIKYLISNAKVYKAESNKAKIAIENLRSGR
jgi:hypothetical protein